MKYWREYYLSKHKRKHFNGLNIGDSGNLFLTYMCVKMQLRINCSVCVCNPSGIVDNVYNKTFEGETFVDFRTLKQAIVGKLQSFPCIMNFIVDQP